MYSLSQEDSLIRKTCDYYLNLISLQDLKEFALLNVMLLLTSDSKDIAALIREIEGSVVEIEEGLLTEEEFRGNLKKILTEFLQEQYAWLKTTSSQKNIIHASWESQSSHRMKHQFTYVASGM